MNLNEKVESKMEIRKIFDIVCEELPYYDTAVLLSVEVNKRFGLSII